MRTTNILFGTFVGFLIALFFLIYLFGAPEHRYVLLSFDVEPVDSDEDVISLLEIIYRNNVSTTFFVTGEYAEERPAVTGLMTGGELACHGYTHKAFTQMSKDEKREELKNCREALKGINGQDVKGFRAPYNKIDGETLSLLEEEGFTYDASMIRGWGVIYPRMSRFQVGEIPVSSVFGLPLEDVVWLHYLNMSRTYFYVIGNKNTHLESYLFHPHHIAKHKKEFEDFIRHLKKGNAIFISHEQLIQMHEGV